MKEVDTQEYVSILRDLVAQGHEVNLLISGNSMLPFLIHQRDTIYFKQPDRPLKVGDMVFYQRQNGQYIMHRIYKIKNGRYYTVGDAQQEIEGPLHREQIFAIITRIRRKGKLIGPGSFWWEFFRCVWIRMVPARHFLMKVYGIAKGGTHG